METIVYEKDTGIIRGHMPKGQTIDNYFYHFPEKFKLNLECLLWKKQVDIYRQKVSNGKIVPMSLQEMEEFKKYNRFLTEEERQLEKLKPTQEEVKKAENTIEILTLIQEVI